MDGRLQEPAWQAAVPATLTQQSPAPGMPTPYHTTVRVLVRGNNLYFGFEATDPQPDRIAVHTKRRDGDVSGDDTLSIVIDSYGDRRTGYFFQTNAAAARVDGLIAVVDDAGLDWDGIWDIRTHRHEEGWSAEFVIPVQSLSFTPGLGGWGVNFERHVARERMRLRWTSPTLDSFIYDLSRAGIMSGTEELRQGRGIQISPYLVGRTAKQFSTGERNYPVRPGMDVTWRMTPQMAAVFTTNTDFAETEVDSRQLNVTRFPLFFPERRAFFLEGANQYQFSIGLDDDNFIPFFSRRIGLYEGQPAPINGGVKLNGRAGRWNLGLLNVQTRDNGFAPGTNLFAGRASLDVTKTWRLGVIATHGSPSGVESNLLAGFDSVWRTSTFRGNKNLLFGTWFAFTAGDLPEGSRSAWGARIDYPNDRWECSADTRQFGSAMRPALGFLRRPGTRQYESRCSFQPRPSRDGRLSFIRQSFFEVRADRVDNFVTGQIESWSLGFKPLDIQFNSGDQISFGFRPRGEQLLEPFEISDGLVLPAGKYQFNRFEVEVETGSQRPWVASVETEFGDFYNGTLLQSEASINWTSPAGTVQAGFSAEHNYGRLLQGNFVQRLWQMNLVYAFNPNLILTNFLQYDNESQSVGNNARLRWTLKPGNDLFVVWNRGWKRLALDPYDVALIPDSELIAVKLRWTFRM